MAAGISLRAGRDTKLDSTKSPECGCPMCRLKRAQHARENHTLSNGVFEEPPEKWQSRRVGDRSPRSSLVRAQPNEFARINQANAEFWANKKRELYGEEKEPPGTSRVIDSSPPASLARVNQANREFWAKQSE